MPPSIPFFRLPNDPQLLIIEYLSLFQLFDFSLLSKRASDIAKSAKRNVKRFCWDADYAYPTFILKIMDYEDNVFNIHIPLNNSMKIPGEITFEGRTLRTAINGERVNRSMAIRKNRSMLIRENRAMSIRENRAMSIRENRSMSIGEKHLSKEDLSELFEKLTEHLLAMFKVENYALLVAKAVDLTKCFMWKYTKTLERLWVHTYEVLTSSEMEFILGEITVTRELVIYSKVAEGFQWTKPLNTGHIHLENGHFLSLDVYLNSKVEQWYIEHAALPTTHLNAIMKKWLDGGMEQLKSFEVYLSSNNRERGLTEALEGIQTFPWDRKTRQKWYGRHDTSKGRDMRRSDGKLATALVDDCFCFHFFVWESDQLQPEDVEEDAH